MARERWMQIVLIFTTLIGSWYGMMIVHEFGHMVGAWATGGSVQRVVLEFLAFSRTDVSPNPRPLVVVWAGPVMGALIPLAAWMVNRAVGRTRDLVARFWAGFCLITNGIYIGVGSFDRLGDAGDMRACGSPAWVLWAFGAAAVVGGFVLWNGLGGRFGFGEAKGRVQRGDVAAATALCAGALVIVAAV